MNLPQSGDRWGRRDSQVLKPKVLKRDSTLSRRAGPAGLTLVISVDHEMGEGTSAHYERIQPVRRGPENVRMRISIRSPHRLHAEFIRPLRV